jgi:regulator of cell morphogenesis and NO signaling
MTATFETPVRDIVTADFRTATVFHTHRIDFCCGGARPLGDACLAAGADTGEVLEELNRVCAEPASTIPNFAVWTSPELIDYIVTKHHAYVREALPTIVAHTEKIARVHGGRHPELVEVSRVFAAVAEDMTSHMWKEEHILFPFIAALADAEANGHPAPAAPFGPVANPIHAMEIEHETAGGALDRIRHLTRDYREPADACTTYAITLKELETFEQDLHAHVHLENNVLFPRAIALHAARR